MDINVWGDIGAGWVCLVLNPRKSSSMCKRGVVSVLLRLAYKPKKFLVFLVG